MYYLTMTAHNPHIDFLYRDHHHWLRMWVVKRINCFDQAEDLTHDTFVRLIQSDKAFEIREPRSYLSTIAKGLIVDKLRRQSLEKSYLDDLAQLPQAHTISEEALACIVETLAMIDQLLDSLPERTRLIFLMAQLDGLTFTEIGRRLQLSMTTVRKHFAKALTHCLLMIDD